MALEQYYKITSFLCSRSRENIALFCLVKMFVHIKASTKIYDLYRWLVPTTNIDDLFQGMLFPIKIDDFQNYSFFSTAPLTAIEHHRHYNIRQFYIAYCYLNTPLRRSTLRCNPTTTNSQIGNFQGAEVAWRNARSD